jgi:hypothetical protein
MCGASSKTVNFGSSNRFSISRYPIIPHACLILVISSSSATLHSEVNAFALDNVVADGSAVERSMGDLLVGSVVRGSISED